MTSDGSAGNNRDGFEAWVASLQRPTGAAPKASEPDITSALVDNSATRVQQIPKELIHRLRERETQGLLGVETERTAVFKPPPELLARAKRMRAPSKPVTPSDAPEAEATDLPTLPPPPEAAVPTVRPPPPAKAESLEDDWAELVEPGLDALKPITPRSVPARPSRPAVPLSSSSAPWSTASPAPRALTSDALTSNRTPASPAPASSSAPVSAPGPAVVVARTVAVVKSAAAMPAELGSTAPVPAVSAFGDADAPDEPTRIQRFAGYGDPAAPEPKGEVEAERSEGTEQRPSGVVPHAEATADALGYDNADRTADSPAYDAPAYDSLAPEGIEPAASGRRWVVIATVFLALVVIALATLAR
jgi:hypothetical protein